jgi:type IV pilus assembly protein PilM
MVLSDEEVARDAMEVLLVAVKRDKVNDYVSVISQAGKNPVIVDVDAFAVQNAYEINYDIDPQQVVALVNMGAGVTTINILSRGATVFWRDMSIGGNQFTEALQREYSLSFDHAERLKRGEQVPGCSPSEARAILEAVSTELAAEIQKTFDFFAATSADDRVTQLVLSGGCALTPNLREVLQDRFNVPTEVLDPLRRVHYRESDFDGVWLQSVAPMLAVAVGLAARKVDD